ncbi:TrbI/VirB10 family protein [bacterium]|nr:TrbI/VirB10 family protein [bacterium]
MTKIMQFLRSFWMKQDGSKQVIDTLKVSVCMGMLMLLAVIFSLFFHTKKEKTLRYSNIALVEPELLESPSDEIVSNQAVKGLTPKRKKVRPKKRRKRKVRTPQRPYDYGAPIAVSFDNPLAVPARGIRMQAMLLHNVDTRIHKVIEVIVHSGIHYHEEEHFPPGTILQGGYQYPGKGSKVYINLNKAITPDGQIKPVRVRTLDFKSKQEGIRGKEKTGRSKRFLSSLGGNVLAGASDVLTEREALNQFGEPTIKANMRNAALQSIYRSSQTETQRSLNNLSQVKEYAVLKKDTVLWIELLPNNRR